jgi:hypothetical protein
MIRRRFLWHGSDNERKGNCMVKWPKHLGGLGILDLQRFNTALRLRWQWQQWAQRHKPWTEMHILVTEKESDLFRACTSISLSDGLRAKF